MTTFATTSEESGSATASPSRAGRKRDGSRDPVILQATLDVLAQTGYAGMTLDMVAARARAGKATLYRRWPTKKHLVLAAIISRGRPLEQHQLPDTGQPRSDLIAIIDSSWLGAPSDGSRSSLA